MKPLKIRQKTLKNEEKIGVFDDFVLARTGFINLGKIRDGFFKVRRSFCHKKALSKIIGKGLLRYSLFEKQLIRRNHQYRYIGSEQNTFTDMSNQHLAVCSPMSVGTGDDQVDF